MFLQRRWLCFAVLAVLSFLVTSSLFGVSFQTTRLKNSKVAMLHLVKDDFSHGALWEFWVKQGLEWAAENVKSLKHPETHKPPALRGMWKQPSNFYRPINSYIHHSVGKLEPVQAAVARLPTIRENVKLCDPVKCKWGATTPCMYQLLKTAFEDDAENAFFIFVSDTTVPAKQFSFMFESLSQNPRSRFPISDLNWPTTPKHDQWIILSRKHAKMLVDNKDLWTKLPFQWMVSPMHKGRADDEYAPLNALYKAYASNSTYEVDVPQKNGTTGEERRLDAPREIFGAPRLENLWRDVNEGLIPPVSKYSDERWVWNDLYRLTFVCWHGDCNKLGDGGRNRPKAFHHVRSSLFLSTILHAHFWFARKFVHECTVDEGETLDAWLIRQLSNSTEQP